MNTKIHRSTRIPEHISSFPFDPASMEPGKGESNPLHLTATTLATYFTREQCDRYLLLEGTKRSRPAPAPAPVPTLVQAQFDKGNEWEEDLCLHLEEKGCLLRCPHGDSRETLNASVDWSHSILQGTLDKLDSLLVDHEDVYIHGTVFRVPTAFYQQHQVSPERVHFALFKPDFLIVRRGEGGARGIQVIDAKASLRLKISHQVQVSFYGQVLETLLDTLGVSNTVIDETGGVWMPSEVMDGKRRIGGITWFQRLSFQSNLERLYQRAQRISQDAPLDPQSTEWAFTTKCALCSFQEICRADTKKEERLGCIPDLSTSSHQWLVHAMGPDRSPDLTPIEDLHRLIQPHARLAFDSSQLHNSEKRRLYQLLHVLPRGRSPVVAAAREKTWQFRPKCTMAMPWEAADVEVFCTLLHNPRTETPYCFSYLLSPSASPETGQSHAVCDLSPIGFRGRMVESLRVLLGYLDEHYHESSVSFFVSTAYEKTLLFRTLAEMALGGQEYAMQAEEILLRLVDDAHCLQLSTQPDFTTPDTVLRSSRVASLISVARELFAIPQAGWTEFPDWYREITGKDQEIPSPEGIYAHAREQKLTAVSVDLLAYNQAMRELAGAMRDRCLEYCADHGALPTHMFTGLPAPLLTHRIQPHAHEILRMVTFINQYELILERQEYLQKRAMGPDSTSLVQIRVGPWDREKKGLWCDVLNGIEFLHDEGDNDIPFYPWIAVRRGDVCGQCSFNDFAFMNMLVAMKTMPDENRSFVSIQEIVLSDGEKAQPSRILVKNKGTRWATDTVLVLLPRVMNFNLKKIEKEAGRISDRLEKGQTSQFIDLLRHPSAWARDAPFPLTPDMGIKRGQAINRTYREAAGLLPQLPLRQLEFLVSQTRAFRAVLQSPLTLVWGPPGTGKTHFLALVMLRLMEIVAIEKCGEMKIFATAYTNAAIDKLLDKVNSLVPWIKEVYRDIPERLQWWEQVRVVRYTGETKELKEQPSIIGSTCWRVPSMRQAIKFDLIIVDEGSQLPVGAAMLFMDRLRKGGRLIVAGDHLQLGPVGM